MSLDLKNDVEQIKRKVENTYSEVLSFNSKLANALTRINDLEYKVNEIDDLKSLHGKCDNFIAEISKKCAQLEAKHESTKAEVGKLTQTIAQHKDAVAALSLSNASLEQSHYKIRSDMQFVSQKLQDSQKSLFDKMQKEFQAHVTTIRSDLAITPKQAFDQNETMIRKVEGAILDGSNAVLRCANLETAIRILEKKIENVQILIKKLELANQL